MQSNLDELANKVAALEALASMERAERKKLSDAIENEALERQEAMLWQEHRLVTAVRSVYQHRQNPALRWAAVGGLASAFLGRSTATAVAGGGVIALLLTAALAFQANYLLQLQNERMDVQTIVMDSQRRSQTFQAEFNIIAADIAAQVTALEKKRNEWEQAFRSSTKAAAEQISTFISSIEDDTRPNQSALKDAIKGFDETAGLMEVAEKFRDIQQRASTLLDDFPDQQKTMAVRATLARFQQTVKDVEKLRTSVLTGDNKFVKEQPVYFSIDTAARLRIAGLSQIVRPYPSLLFGEPGAPVSAGSGVLNKFFRLLSIAQFPAPTFSVRLTDSKTSPERGQLLTLLAAQRIWLPDIFQAGADFTSTDLSLRSFGPAYLRNVILNGSNFFGTHFSTVVMKGEFRASDFRCTYFADSSLVEADLTGSNFSGAIFLSDSPTLVSTLNLADADFTKARLGGARLDLPERAIDAARKKAENGISLGELLTDIYPDRLHLADRYKGFTVRLREDATLRIRHQDFNMNVPDRNCNKFGPDSVRRE